jgi:hypothetical protein
MSQLDSASDDQRTTVPISAAGGFCSAAGTADTQEIDLLLGSFADTFS